MSNKTRVSRELNELRNQLSYSKRIGFFLGAGASKAVGIPDINTLTNRINDNLDGPQKQLFEKLLLDLEVVAKPNAVNVEHILDHIRLIRRITLDKGEKEFDTIKGNVAAELDKKICDEIYQIISSEEKTSDCKTTQKYVSWLNWLSKDFTKEIFTTNYDLILEKSFEKLQVPFFDGFVGANESFFFPSSLETNYYSSSQGKDFIHSDSPPNSWIRLWKLHGSLGWFWVDDKKSERIIRVSPAAKYNYKNNELVIYPSREKYDSSRKQPFIAYFDRLKYFLQDGEGLFIISGYSFSDDHVNEIIYNGAKFNNRIHIICFYYRDEDLQKLIDSDNIHMNITAYSPNRILTGGNEFAWEEPKIDEDTSDLVLKFWNQPDKHLELGDFNKLVDFFLICTGRKEKFDREILV